MARKTGIALKEISTLTELYQEGEIQLGESSSKYKPSERINGRVSLHVGELNPSGTVTMVDKIGH